MTREEAIDIILNEKRCVQTKTCDHYCQFCILAKTEEEIVGAFDMAVEALQKRVE